MDTFWKSGRIFLIALLNSMLHKNTGAATGQSGSHGWELTFSSVARSLLLSIPAKVYEIEKGLENTWGFITKIIFCTSGKWLSGKAWVWLLLYYLVNAWSQVSNCALLCLWWGYHSLCKAHVRSSWKNSVGDSYKPEQLVLTKFLTSELLSLCRCECSLASHLFFIVRPANPPCRCTKSTVKK